MSDRHCILLEPFRHFQHSPTPLQAFQTCRDTCRGHQNHRVSSKAHYRHQELSRGFRRCAGIGRAVEPSLEASSSIWTCRAPKHGHWHCPASCRSFQTLLGLCRAFWPCPHSSRMLWDLRGTFGHCCAHDGTDYNLCERVHVLSNRKAHTSGLCGAHAHLGCVQGTHDEHPCCVGRRATLPPLSNVCAHRTPIASCTTTRSYASTCGHSMGRLASVASHAWGMGVVWRHWQPCVVPWHLCVPCLGMLWPFLLDPSLAVLDESWTLLARLLGHFRGTRHLGLIVVVDKLEMWTFCIFHFQPLGGHHLHLKPSGEEKRKTKFLIFYLFLQGLDVQQNRVQSVKKINTSACSLL